MVITPHSDVAPWLLPMHPCGNQRPSATHKGNNGLGERVVAALDAWRVDKRGFSSPRLAGHHVITGKAVRGREDCEGNSRHPGRSPAGCQIDNEGEVVAATTTER